jgi:transposase
MRLMSRAKGRPQLPIEQKVRIVLSVLAGEITPAEAARRHGVSPTSVMNWRDRFVQAGTAGLEARPSGPGGQAGSSTERRLRLEAEQLKLALAEATVQLRIWQKGAEQVHKIPSSTSRP